MRQRIQKSISWKRNVVNVTAIWMSKKLKNDETLNDWFFASMKNCRLLMKRRTIITRYSVKMPKCRANAQLFTMRDHPLWEINRLIFKMPVSKTPP